MSSVGAGEEERLTGTAGLAPNSVLGGNKGALRPGRGREEGGECRFYSAALRGRPGAVARRRLPGILALSVLICTRRGTLGKGSARQIPGMHHDGGYKTSACHKVRGTSKPCFSGGCPERFICSLSIYIYIIYLHLAYTNAK